MTRTFNVAQPAAVRQQFDFGVGALLDQARPATWASDAVDVSGVTCPAAAPLLSPSAIVRHPILAP